MIQLYNSHYKPLGREVSSVLELFTRHKEIVASLAYNVNVYYSVSHAKSTARGFDGADSFAIDIDGIAPNDLELWPKYLDIVAAYLRQDHAKFSVVLSGHGLHFLLHLDEASRWDRPEYFQVKRSQWGIICAGITMDITRAQLSGKADTAVFDRGRILRVPGTVNHKKDKPEVLCTLAQLSTGLVQFDIDSFSPSQETLSPDLLLAHESSETLEGEILHNPPAPTGQLWFRPDNQAVLGGCHFIKWCNDNQDKVSEQQWYAMLGVTSFLDNGYDISHKYSEKHPKYTKEETTKKINQALTSSGPRTCVDISSRWEGCKACPHYTKVVSPISIKSEDFLRSEQDGFWNIHVAANGRTTRNPAITDISKKFTYTFHHKYIADEDSWYIYKKSHWERVLEQELDSWVQNTFNPQPERKAIVSEVVDFIKRREVGRMSFFYDTVTNKINLRNGVLDLNTMTLLPHSPLYGFRATLEFDYTPGATAPKFSAWFLDLLDGDKLLFKCVMEFLAYALSGVPVENDKILFLRGSGSNGKTTFINTLKMIFGESFQEMRDTDLDKAFTMKKMEHKKIGYFDEFSSSKNKERWELLKSMASGGIYNCGEKFKPEYSVKNKTKIIMSANELPGGTDPTHGYFRRLLIIPLDKEFTEENKILSIEHSFESELPGIMNMLIESMVSLKERGWIIKAPEASKEALERYTLEKDIIYSFIKECFKDTQENLWDRMGNHNWIKLYHDTRYDVSRTAIPKKVIWKAFCTYCEDNNIRNYVSYLEFIRKILERTKKLKIREHIVSFSAKTERCFIGIIPTDELVVLIDRSHNS
jgi:P4 family phage/plasmid primase-like protien